jgi:hypothetical protein
MIVSFQLPHDKVPARIALPVLEFLARKCIPVLPQAPYSQNFSSCHFRLFPKLKSRVKRCHFQTLDSVQKPAVNAIKILTEAELQSCYEA